MAFRGQWRSMLGRLRQNRPFASVAGTDAPHPPKTSKFWQSADFVPVYVVAGTVSIALLFAIHTAKQQLLHSPAVNFNKRRRESMYEVDEPDVVVGNADKFINKSFLRKVAHIQDTNRTLPDPSRPDPFLRPRTAETLKTVGVKNPSN